MTWKCRIKGGWGWRLSLGLAGIPAVLLTVGALLVVDTPNSLIERGHLEEGKAVLKKIRGTDNVEPEFLELVEASRVAHEVKHPFRNLLKRSNRPQLVISIALQVSPAPIMHPLQTYECYSSVGIYLLVFDTDTYIFNMNWWCGR